MKNLALKTLLPAVGISILAASPCLAQVEIAPTPLTPETKFVRKRAHQIRLLHVKPSVMAWWLDPKNQPQPAGATPELRLKELPDGVDRIVAIDPQNALLVFGTDEGVRKLRELVQFLDSPQDKIPLRFTPSSQITVGARLLTIQTEALSGIWAALSTQTGRATPAIAFLKSDEELDLGGQIARREARFERVENFAMSSGARTFLDFGPAYTGRSNREMFENFQSDMPVLTPPETGDMFNPIQGRAGRLLPAPLGDLRLQIAPTLQKDNAVSLELGAVQPAGILGRAQTARFEMRAGETLALTLPNSTPGTSAFLLFTARPQFQISPSNRIPLLGDLPIIGGLFRAPIRPEKTP